MTFLEFDFLTLMFFGIIILMIYSHIVTAIEKNRKKDLCPLSEYPHVALFKYFCIFIISLVCFLSFGFLVSFIIFIMIFLVMYFVAWCHVSQEKKK
jgi:hypothetical protein